MSIDVSKGTYRGVAEAPANTANRLYTFPDASGTVLLGGSSGTAADPQICVSTEFAEGLQAQSWFDDLYASGVHGIAIALQNGSSPYASASDNIIKAQTAGLWVCGYARPLPVLAASFAALTAPAQAALRFIVLDAEAEALIGAENDDVHADVADNQTVNTGITNPASPRNLTVTLTGSTAGAINGRTITINGTDPDGAAQQAVFTVDTTNPDFPLINTSYKAFTTVTDIVIQDLGHAGNTIRVGLGGRYATTKAMLAAAGAATGKEVWIYTSWGGWSDTMGDYPDHAYGTFAYETPWAGEKLWQRDLYDPAETLPTDPYTEHPTDMYTEYGSFNFESWPTNKVFDWTTRQAVQWADGDTYGGTDFDFQGVTCTWNVFDAASLGFTPGDTTGTAEHTHTDSLSGGSTLSPAVLTLTGDLRMLYTSGAQRIRMGTIDSGLVAGEGLEVYWDFSTDRGRITLADFDGGNYKDLDIVVNELIISAGSAGTAGQIKLDNTTAAIMQWRPRAATNYTTLKRTADTAGDLTFPVTGTVSVDGHGHAEHANRTRKFPLSLIAWDNTVNATRYVQFADAVTTDAVFGAILPADYINTGTVNLVYLYGSSVASNNVRVLTAVYEERNAAIETQIDTTTTNRAISANANEMSAVVDALTTNPTAGDSYIKVLIRRIGGDGGDTNTGVMRILGPWLEYTSDE
jgi:hypothetical protein